MSRVYNLVDKIKNGNKKPTVKLDKEHEFTINNSFPAAIAIKAYAEDEELDDMERIKRIVGTAFNADAISYIDSLELPMPLYIELVNVIMAAISDMELDEIEKISEDKKKAPSR
ncbi:MAG: hypothetical protein LIR50_05675 [Bacillota bacterium]|nr:hypothetical protein [Bacillota bacterium]